MISRRRLIAAVGLAALGVVLVGCAPQPTVLPDVIVEHEGTSPLDENEWVKAIRASELAMALAWNSGDFTLEALGESTSPGDIDKYYGRYATNAREERAPIVYSGPSIWAPISVTPSGDSADIVACVATQDRGINAEHPGTVYGLDTGVVWNWTFERLPSGAIEQTWNQDTGEQCSAEMAEVLTFDPAPTLPEKINEGDIRAPKGDG